MNVRICVPAILLAFAAFWAVGRASRAQTPALPGGKPVAVAPKAFDELQVIDHWNLRYDRDDDDPTLDEQVAQIRRNMDVAAKLGFTSYLLFQEDAFPDLLTWGGKHEPDEDLRRAVGEVLDHAKQRRLKLYLHCNEFMWPDRVGVDYGDTDQAWKTYRNALLELIALYPDLAGFEVTADETGGALETKPGVLKFHNETARALTADGRQRIALMRTWQRVGVLGSPDTLGDGDEPNVVFSVKNTSEDFRCNSGFDEDLLQVKDPGRLLVEFDAWREYETHNVFPIYLGDYWAPRFEALAEAGVKRVGLRFNWNSGRYPITERPWSNWVNVFTFVRLTENPRANPDDILREFVSIYYPPEARDAAFDLYKASFEFVREIYYCEGEKISDHGRVNRLRKIGGKSVDRDWLKHVDAQLKRMLEKIDALPERGAHQAELRRGAVAVSSMSKACGLQLGAQGDTAFLTEWKASDLESFERLRGHNAYEWLESQDSKRRDTAAEPVEPSPADDGDVYEAERAELEGAIVGSKGEDELHEGATGGDYVDFQENSGESIAWVIKLDEAGPHRLSFRYALDDEDARPLRLTVNGEVVVEAVPFADTGDWDSWKSIAAEAELQKGRNTIRLESIGDSGPNIDHLRIERLAPAAADAPAPMPVRPSASQTAKRSKTVVGDGVSVEFYPVTPIHRSDGKTIGTVQGQPITFESFRTSEQYYYDVSYAWLAADGPVDVVLNVDAPVTRGVLRGVLSDIPFRLSDSTFTFTLPGPGHYYLQLPELGQPVTVHGDCPDFRGEVRKNGTVPLGRAPWTRTGQSHFPGRSVPKNEPVPGL